MSSEAKTTTEASVTSTLPLADVLKIIEGCRQLGVKRLAWGDLRVEFAEGANEFLASRETSAEQGLRHWQNEAAAQSEKARQVTGANYEIDAWTKASAPDVFEKGIEE